LKTLEEKSEALKPWIAVGSKLGQSWPKREVMAPLAYGDLPLGRPLKVTPLCQPRQGEGEKL